MSEPTQSNAGEDAKSGFDVQEAGGESDIQPIPDIGENIQKGQDEQQPQQEQPKKSSK
jgi:hypothetical protein